MRAREQKLKSSQTQYDQVIVIGWFWQVGGVSLWGKHKYKYKDIYYNPQHVDFGRLAGCLIAMQTTWFDLQATEFRVASTESTPQTMRNNLKLNETILNDTKQCQPFNLQQNKTILNFKLTEIWRKFFEN